MSIPDRTLHAAKDALKGAGKLQRLFTRRIRRGIPRGVPAVFSRRRSPIGASPGTLISDPEAPPPVLRIVGYGPDVLEERTLESPEELADLRGRWPVLWLNVDGVGDAAVVEAIGETFGLHKLALEDVMNVHQRSKVEEYPQHLFIVARMAVLQADGRLDSEQFSIFIAPGVLITFQERVGDPLDPVRERIRAGRPRLRQGGADYLAYAILDAVIDGYYPVLEAYGDLLEELEAGTIEDPRDELLGRIHDARRDILHLRHAVWPMRDAMGQLYRDPSDIFTEETRIFLRDAYDHTVQIMDLLENFRENASGLLDVYLSSLSHRMNEVMKVLTIIATIFIPLTFIAGIYGMNFDPDASPLNMPELSWYWGYPAVWLVMVVLALVLVAFFRRRGWF